MSLASDVHGLFPYETVVKKFLTSLLLFKGRFSLSFRHFFQPATVLGVTLGLGSAQVLPTGGQSAPPISLF